MLTKNELKYYSSLLNKKFRLETNKFLVEGSKLISEATEYGFECEIIIHTHLFEEENDLSILKFLSGAKRVECIKNPDFRKLTDTKSPQEIVGVFYSKESRQSLYEGKLIVALENINDPGNLGSIIRNCDWFGVNHVVLSKDCAEVFNPKVIRSSAGSVFHISFNRTEQFYTELETLKNDGYKILCTDLDGENIYDRKWEGKVIVVMSNEANGPTDRLLQIAGAIITIPSRGKAESLNVASACAVILSEVSRR
jgi:RNA methyltransferase, TrmH family